MKKRKQPLTLLEIVIALFLTGIILTTLLVFFKDYSLTNIKLKTVKEHVLARQTCYLRLNNLFSSMQTPKNGTSGFYTDTYNESAKEALFFTFNNGADLDPDFCNTLKGVLYLTKGGALHLIIQGEGGKTRKEVLFQNLSQFTLQFFDEEEKNWSPSWPRSKEKPPLMLKIELPEKKEKEPLVFSFFLPGVHPIIYEEQG